MESHGRGIRNDADYSGTSIIHLADGRILRVFIDVFLPSFERNKIEVMAYPTAGQYKKLWNRNIKSMKLIVRDTGGGIINVLALNEPYVLSGKERYYGVNSSKCLMTLHASNCHVSHNLELGESGKKGRAYFTDYSKIPIFSGIEKGHRKIKLDTKSIHININRDIRFALKKIIDNLENKYNIITIVDYKFSNEINSVISLRLFLNIISVAIRCRLFLFRLDEQSNGRYYNEFYRYPGTMGEKNEREELIPGQYFAEFVKSAYKKILCFGEDCIYNYLYKINSYDDSTLEKDFIYKYAALESVINYIVNKSRTDLHIINNDIWARCKETVIKVLEKNHVKDDEFKIIKDKIDNANYLGFSEKINMACHEYNVKIDDLWPIGGKFGLSSIRNKFIHGHDFAPSTYGALQGAREHLRWILERILIGLLGWPIEKTTVNSAYLGKNSAVYNELNKDITALKRE
jgi:hypothetical protein